MSSGGARRITKSTFCIELNIPPPQLNKFIAVGNVSEAARKRNDNWPGWRLDNNQCQVLQEVSSSAESANLDWTESV